VFVTSAALAAMLLDASITGNPINEKAWLAELLFLNPYAFGVFLFAFLAANVVPVWRLLDGLFYRHPQGTVVAPVLWSLDEHPASVNASLMPNVYEFIDPRETTSHYQRETERLRAFKEKLDAETAFAEAYIRRQRAGNHLNDGI
jgi:hypothetical protein